MKERPILFSGPMVNAILDGRKTQTRRVVKRQRDMEFDENDPHFGPYWLSYVYGEDSIKVPCPYGQPGDRLWVRESFDVLPLGKAGEEKNIEIAYWADGQTLAFTAPVDYNPMIYGVPKVRPSIHMPRWASRITLEVTGVRVERLQDISEADARAEGAKSMDIVTGRQTLDPNSRQGSYIAHYRDLWESINGPGSWATNPWVWVVEFKQQGEVK